MLATRINPTYLLFWCALTALSTVWLVGHRSEYSLVLVAVGVIVGAALASMRVMPLHSALISQTADARATVTVTGVVNSDPIIIHRSSGLDWSTSAATVIPLSVRQLHVRGTTFALALPMTVMTNTQTAKLVPGTVVQVVGRLVPSSPGRNSAAVIRAYDEVIIVRGPPRYQAAAQQLRLQLRENLSEMPEPARELVPGLALGDSSNMGTALSQDMRNSGLSHLIAVSGANVALIIVVMVWITRKFTQRTQLLIAIVSVCAFVVLVRPQPSVMRAATMGIVVLVSRYFRPRSSSLPALACAVLLLVVVDPWLAISYGFALSVFATAGLLLYAETTTKTLTALVPRCPTWLVQAVAVTIVCQIAVMPFLVALGSSLTWASIPANAMAVPLAGFVMGAGLLSALFGLIWDPLGQLLAWCAAIPALVIAQVARTASHISWLQIDWPVGPAGVAGASTIVALLMYELSAWRSRTMGERGTVSLLVLALVFQCLTHQRVSYLTWPPPNWQIVMCDVGQGDSAVIRVGAHSAIVIDTGPVPESVDRCLRDLAINHVPLLVLTHFHADHVGGLTGVLNQRRVGTVLLPPLGEPKFMKSFVNKELERRRIDARPLNYLDRISFNSQDIPIVLDCIWPQRIIRNQGSDANNSSLVLLATVGQFKYLFTGDIEPPAQEALLRLIDLPAVDVLKIAHHGSANQFPEFAWRASPRFVLVSVGADNDYGHPATSALALYQSVGAQIYRTDQSGDIAVVEVENQTTSGLNATGPRTKGLEVATRK